jgi:predicted SprT family Zn-dependent metalloprotease
LNRYILKQNEFYQLVSSIQTKLVKDYPFIKQWQVGIDNAKRRAGVCLLTQQKINISQSHFSNNSISIVSDTLLHEFAHAIAFEQKGERGHGSYWKSVAAKIGATPKATGRFTVAESPWQLVYFCSKSEQLEVLASRYRRNKKIKKYELKGRPETKGKLFYATTTEIQGFQSGQLTIKQLTLCQ